MVASSKVNLPEELDIDVEEINLSISALRAGAFHLGAYCENKNNEFMLCKQENSDPRSCLQEGKNVTSCALGFFQKVKAHCHEEFTQYSKCLFQSSGDMKFSLCRNTQAVYDKCVGDELGMERPDYGYFCRIKVHHTDRPRPIDTPQVYSDVPDKLPLSVEKPRANFGTRFIL